MNSDLERRDWLSRRSSPAEGDHRPLQRPIRAIPDLLIPRESRRLLFESPRALFSRPVSPPRFTDRNNRGC